MSKAINHDENHMHKKVHSTKGQRKSNCGNYIYMQDGSRFRVTTLPSVATGQTTEEEDVLAELEQLDELAVKEQ